MEDILITQDVLEKLRTFPLIEEMGNENIESIVPDILSHQYLLFERSVDKVIKDCYIGNTISLLTKEEFLNLPKDYFHSIYTKAISPFPYIIEGAYHSRLSLLAKVKVLLRPYEKHKLKGNSSLNNFQDLKPYFIEYAEGFQEGFSEFENNRITPLLLNLGVSDKESFVNEIFSFITNNLVSEPIVTTGTSFSSTISYEGVFEINHGYEDGLKEGYLYKAWSIIFSHSDLFTPLFQKYISVGNIDEIKNNKFNKDNILKMQNNLISKVSLQYVYDFFSVLIKPNKKGTFYLDEQKLLIFIESTFINKEPTQQFFNVSFSKDKKDVRSVFRRFYENCFDLEYDKKNLSRKYFDIMNDAFIGFSVDKDLPKWHETNNNIPTKDYQKVNYKS